MGIYGIRLVDGGESEGQSLRVTKYRPTTFCYRVEVLSFSVFQFYFKICSDLLLPSNNPAISAAGNALLRCVVGSDAASLVFPPLPMPRGQPDFCRRLRDILGQIFPFKPLADDANHRSSFDRQIFSSIISLDLLLVGFAFFWSCMFRFLHRFQFHASLLCAFHLTAPLNCRLPSLVTMNTFLLTQDQVDFRGPLDWHYYSHPKVKSVSKRVSLSSRS